MTKLPINNGRFLLVPRTKKLRRGSSWRLRAYLEGGKLEGRNISEWIIAWSKKGSAAQAWTELLRIPIILSYAAFWKITFSAIKWQNLPSTMEGSCLCPGLDSNQHAHSAPPPQDGVSTNFTTWAGSANIIYSSLKKTKIMHNVIGQ